MLFISLFLSLGLLSPLLVDAGGLNSECSDSNGKETVTVQAVVGRFVHAEGPHWDHRSQKLYFVDIDAQKICRLDPVTEIVTCAYIENGPVGFVVTVNDMPYRLAAGVGRNFSLITWNDERNMTNPVVQTLSTVDEDHPENRFNDGKVDSHGRLWAGTIGPEKNEQVEPDVASLYRIASDLKPEKELSPVTNSNGLAWNVEDNKFFYIDTPTLQIAEFDYEPHEGTISNRRVAFDLAKNNITGYPDGMTIDTDGNLWIALYNGGRVINVNPRTQELIRYAELPVRKVTSCTFGGPLLNTLYVTTSSRGLTDEELEQQPKAGYVFAVNGLGVHGLLANDFRMQ